MKKIIQVLYLSVFLVFITGCDKDFVEINTNPFEISKIDLGLVFAGSQRVSLGGWESEHTIVQQFVNPFNDGATLGFNFNENIDGQQNGSFGQYTGPVKTFVHILNLLEGTTTQVNLQSMVRIWKAAVFMDIVDHYGNVPYFDAGLAAIKGEEYFYPAYDDDEEIYNDLYLELKDAISKLNPAGDFVTADLFYGSKAFYPVTTATAQVAKWKKLGNSLLLRLGMRYSKLNPTLAASIALEAFNGGVMTANTDNAFVVYDGTLYTNGSNGGLINNNPRFYYAAEPFVNQLKNTNDPRCKYIVATYANPNDPLGDPAPNTNPADQYGVPIGVLASSLASAPYRGIRGGGYNYSQMNVRVVASISAPTFWVTYAQTSLLVAEAIKRGYIPGGDALAQTYYEAGIIADMDAYTLILARTGNSLPAVTAQEKTDYLAHADVAYNATDALELIGTQYWIATIRQGGESWANRRRTGFPVLAPNPWGGASNPLIANGGDGYVHRFTYPDSELSQNRINYEAAVEELGGIDDLVKRVFWDIP